MHNKSTMTLGQFLENNFTLDKLSIGSYARIVSVGGNGALRRRLLDMGLTPKTIIFLRKTAPLGDPLELMLRGYELTLRKDDAKEIVVTPFPEKEDVSI